MASFLSARSNIETVAVVHITEAQLARDVRGVLERIEAGAEIIVERNSRPIAVMKRPAGRAAKSPGPPNPDDEYTPEQRKLIDARLDEALEEVNKGHTAGPFDTADEMVAFIKREIRKRTSRKGSKASGFR
jgi:antitoxin (DNA-binding transcriptional repressor) of toxin-antitoxin stability system